MAVLPAEFTVICIDNSKRMYFIKRLFKAQLEAIRFYCKTTFKCNPENIVSICTMGSLQYGTQVHPTSDLKKILRGLEDVQCEGDAEFQHVLGTACSIFSRSPKDMKRRLLMFVGGPINLQTRLSIEYGKKLKERGVALDVFNFYLLKIDASLVHCTILSAKYRYAREDLDVLVTTANDNGNSHVVDVVDECGILSESILRKNLHYLEKKATADDEYVEAPRIQFVKPKLEPFPNEKSKSAADDRCVQAPGFENLSKKTPHLSKKKNQEKTKRKVLMSKQELEPSCNEKNQAAAEYGKHSPPLTDLKPAELVKPKLERFHNEKSKSAADDKCVQAPEIENLAKKTPHLLKKKNQKKAKRKSKQELELSCNEKNQAAAE